MPLSQKDTVLRYLASLAGGMGDWSAISAQISELGSEGRDDTVVQAAANNFKNLFPRSNAKVFIMGNQDIFYVFPKKYEDQVNAVLIKLRFLFSNDPFIIADPNFQKFIKRFDLLSNFPEVEKYLVKANDVPKPTERVILKSKNQGFSSRPKNRIPGKPLTAKLLSKVEQALSKADFSNMIRRQSVCAVVGNSQPYRLFDEVFVDIENLRSTVLPDIDLSLNPWLFMHLTETLDERVMSIINNHDDSTLSNDFSINLNVSTILSDSFIAFDDSIKHAMRSSIVFELQLIDIFSDLRSFFLARDIAHDKGYRICIDGITHDMLPLVDRAEINADLVKIIWDEELAIILDKNPEAIQIDIDRNGANNVILCRVDDQHGLEVGRSLGITMYQGYHVQRSIDEDVRNRRIGTVLVNEMGSKK
jgi:hypothetical protein